VNTGSTQASTRRDAFKAAVTAVLISVAVSCRPREPTPPAARVASSETSTAQRDDTPRSRQFAAWLAAFNSGDRATLLAYHDKSFPYDVATDDVANIDLEFGLRQHSGGFDLRQTDESHSSIVAILKERRSDQFARATMLVDANEPHGVTRFEIHPISTPEQFRATRMSEGDALEALRTEIEATTSRDQFSGVLLVAKNGAVIFSEARGLADRERKIPNELDVRFRIGSMNKMFTAVAILQLEQAGKIALSDPFGKFFPNYPNKRLAATVTIHHLLTHTGGTGDIFGPEFLANRLELRTIQDYVKLYGGRALRFEPGTQWEYSNYGFILLGAVIEKATGQSYYDWVSSHVFEPAGMTSTASPAEDHFEPGRSVGYTRPAASSSWISNADAPVPRNICRRRRLDRNRSASFRDSTHESPASRRRAHCATQGR
jgi:CubicO group peptidase (beta-lactamase class C family)